MNAKIIPIWIDVKHDNCYICDTSLVYNYTQKGVAIIKDKKGAHFICKKCLAQLLVKKRVKV